MFGRATIRLAHILVTSSLVLWAVNPICWCLWHLDFQCSFTVRAAFTVCLSSLVFHSYSRLGQDSKKWTFWIRGEVLQFPYFLFLPVIGHCILQYWHRTAGMKEAMPHPSGVRWRMKKGWGQATELVLRVSFSALTLIAGWQEEHL